LLCSWRPKVPQYSACLDTTFTTTEPARVCGVTATVGQV
jgi:hypothetical protein